MRLDLEWELNFEDFWVVHSKTRIPVHHRVLPLVSRKLLRGSSNPYCKSDLLKVNSKF
ncbi:hypothetical protein RchiOBHm_Chr1g0381551 [Rosa chinensis]|uniref:Uncharacterized protein n=1 Tax=Rosa chinensis TaxID=74649 RepID=A0A2P6SP60_ROSCH|nr:hypothetical protein RchiOBHm_Chr1g0381551 [Rosa chinensis]